MSSRGAVAGRQSQSSSPRNVVAACLSLSGARTNKYRWTAMTPYLAAATGAASGRFVP